MPIRRSPNDARHPRPQGGRDHPEQVVAINRNDWSQSIGTPGRDHPVRAAVSRAKGLAMVFGAPRLRDAKCKTVDEMRLVNTLCALREIGMN